MDGREAQEGPEGMRRPSRIEQVHRNFGRAGRDSVEGSVQMIADEFGRRGVDRRIE